MTRAKARPRKQRELLQTLLSLLGPIRKEKGCMGSRFCLSIEDENDFILVEEWKTQVDFEKHIRSEEFRVLHAALNVLCLPLETRMNVFSGVERHNAMEQVLNGLVGKD
jgi:quinol monooxygenase YgiN